jgi:hypothetical protein
MNFIQNDKIRHDIFFLIMDITNLTCNELIMKIIKNSFIHTFIHFTHEYHALKTHSFIHT